MPWFHATVVATVLAAAVAVGTASAPLLVGVNAAAPKADRLPVMTSASGYVTIETRHDGVSILKRVQVMDSASTSAS